MITQKFTHYHFLEKVAEGLVGVGAEITKQSQESSRGRHVWQGPFCIQDSSNGVKTDRKEPVYV
jgi:hypothetical protein